MSTERRIQLPHLIRAATVSHVSTATREFNITFSSGLKLLRVDSEGNSYIEQLSLDPGHVRLDRLNGGAPLLNTHMGRKLEHQIGVVVERSARVDGRTATARIRLSNRRGVDDIALDLADGIIRNVSVGYRVHKYEERAGKAGTPRTRTAVDWEPYEISLVPMPADSGAQVHRAANQDGTGTDTPAALTVVLAHPYRAIGTASV